VIPFRLLRTTFAVLIASTFLAAQDSKALPASPGKAIQDAARAAAHDVPNNTSSDRPKSGTVVTLYGAEGKAGNVEVLTDTQGVNFGPYLKDVVATVRKNWFALIPADAKTKKGKLVIEFAIHQDGSLTNLHLAAASGDVSLDRAAWGAVTSSSPFAALPSAFSGPYLALRFRFYYNPTASDLGGGKASRAIGDSVVHAVLMQETADSHRPKYPKKARSAKIEGIVWLEAGVKANGEVGDLKVLEGDSTLAEASAHAVRKWRFHPAQINSKPVEDRARIKVEFRLDGAQVRTEVVAPEPPA